MLRIHRLARPTVRAKTNLYHHPINRISRLSTSPSSVYSNYQNERGSTMNKPISNASLPRSQSLRRPCLFTSKSGSITLRSFSTSSSDAATPPSAAPLKLSSTYQPITSQQERWNVLRTLTANLTISESQPKPLPGLSSQPSSSPEWFHLPNLRAQPSSHHNLQQDTHIAPEEDNDATPASSARPSGNEAEDDETLRSFLVSHQSIPQNFHKDPVLLTPHVRHLWKRLTHWDRQQQIKAIQADLNIQSNREEAAKKKSASILNSSDDAESTILPINGWSNRGVFLDGPNGISKSTSLYSLVCMARSQNWLVVHIADADSWVGALAEGGATRMFVQAVYEACASTILPSTSAWSQPHSILQLPLSPQLDYTATLIEQGIHTFGELLQLSLELADGLEETELSVECIMDQLFHIESVPVLIAIDSFDALTQKCLQTSTKNADADEDSTASDGGLVAPISTSPFSYMNYYRAPAFRGGFLLTGESFALVQQSHPELMERIQTKSSSTMIDEDGEVITNDDEEDDEPNTKSTNLMQQHPVGPIHVYPLPPLSSTLSTEYLIKHLLNDPRLAQSCLRAATPAYWSYLYQHIHSGHFSLMNFFLQLPALTLLPDLLKPSDMRITFEAVLRYKSGLAYEQYFASESDRMNLAMFFAQHLPQGFYKDWLRKERHPRSVFEAGMMQQIARDYNLIAINQSESISMISWIEKHFTRTMSAPAPDSEAVSLSPPWLREWNPLNINTLITSSAPYLQLTTYSPSHTTLSKSELTLLQFLRTEFFLQVLGMGLLMKQQVKFTTKKSEGTTPILSTSQSYSVYSISHWCSTTDPPILEVEEIHSLNFHWNIPPKLDQLIQESGQLNKQPTPYLTRIVHVGSVGDPSVTDERVVTLFVPNLDPTLSDLLFVSPTRPITSLMHTLYLHYLAEIMQQLEVAIGPTLQVRAQANDGSSYTWRELDDLVESLQGGLFDHEPELPLQHLTITQLLAVPTDASVDRATPPPLLRVCFVSPHGRGKSPPTITLSTAEATNAQRASTAAVNLPTGAASTFSPVPAPATTPSIIPSSVEPDTSHPPAFHPLFQFVHPLIGEDLANLLDVKVEDLQKIRWN